MGEEDGPMDKFSAILVFVIATSFLLFFLGDLGITGQATSGTTISNVSISKYLAISFGANLSEGIQFGTVATLPATNINATHNNDSNTYSGGTTYTIDVSTDSNTPVDFCIRANVGLTSLAADVIGLGNETYEAYNITNSTHPDLALETSMTTSYVKAFTGIVVGNSSYWRFWLDIPASQPSGTYNNTVSFEGVVTGNSC